MPWEEIEARVAQVFSRKGRAGVAMPDLDLFGEQVQRAAVASNAGRPRVALRIMIALLYLKHAFNESDEGVVARWADTLGQTLDKARRIAARYDQQMADGFLADCGKTKASGTAGGETGPAVSATPSGAENQKSFPGLNPRALLQGMIRGAVSETKTTGRAESHGLGNLFDT